ncbi:MAG: hypothetical protein ACI9E1_000408 [Cryomorphaceae bacterium]|jgi:hypothetical protein
MTSKAKPSPSSDKAENLEKAAVAAKEKRKALVKEKINQKTLVDREN